MKATLGHGGRWIADSPTPLVVDLRNSGDGPVAVRVEIEQGQAFGTAPLRWERDVYLGVGAARREVFLVSGPRPYEASTRLLVETQPRVPLHWGRQTADRGRMEKNLAEDVQASAAAVAFESRVLGVVNDDRNVLASRFADDTQSALDRGTTQATALADARVAVVAVDPSLLHLAPHLLIGMDALVVRDPDTTFAADPAAMDGLLDWVALGGRLVISLGERSAQFASSPLAAELPATWTGPERIDYGAVARTYLPPGLAPVASTTGPWTRLRPRAGANVRHLGGRSDEVLEVGRRFGSGEILVLAYDVRQAVAFAPPEKGSLTGIAAMLSGRAARQPDDQRNDWNWNRLGVGTGFASALQAGAFEPPPLPLVLLGLVLYVVVVGPLDWFVLKRMRKERLTTLTFAGSVAAFTIVAYGASLVVFATGPRTNRIVLVDLIDGGRGGREVLRVHDIAGYYSPHGADRDLRWTLPTVVLPSELPGDVGTGDVGRALPVTIRGADPRTPEAAMEVAFRSQRVLRVEMSGVTGRSVEVLWEGEGPHRALRVRNDLPVDLERVVVLLRGGREYAVGSVSAGTVSRLFASDEVTASATDSAEGHFLRHSAPYDVAGDLAWLSHATSTAQSPAELDLVRLRKLGFDRSASIGEGRALLVATAKRSPVPLAGGEDPGDVHVVIRKEIPLP